MIFNCPVPTLLKWIFCSTLVVFCVGVPATYYGTWKAFERIYKGEIPDEHEFHPEDGLANSNFTTVGVGVIVAYVIGWGCFLALCVGCCCKTRGRANKTYVLINNAQQQQPQLAEASV
jgi:hypothetical protein